MQGATFELMGVIHVLNDRPGYDRTVVTDKAFGLGDERTSNDSFKVGRIRTSKASPIGPHHRN